MTVINSLMIAAPELQEALVDKAGNPLVNGTVTLTIDTARLTLKNWYYQTGSPGFYTFTPLDNPLTLSAAGTIQDPSGNDTIPYYYPYDESNTTNHPPIQKYYITVDDSSAVRQWDRQNFPLNVPSSSPTSPTFENIVVNNEFWRNIGSVASPTLTNGTVLAPSQHDGFRMPDVQFRVTGSGDTETISFPKFPTGAQTLTGDVTPEFYLNYNCSISLGGETFKIIQVPLSLHLLTLGSLANVTVTLQAKSASSSTIFLNILADYGTGVVSPPATSLGFAVLDANWTKYTFFVATMPPSSGLVSQAGDDAFYLQILLPSGTANIDIAKISFYLSQEVPTNDFSTYDHIDSIINDARTGDIRTSMNAFSPYGWVPMNDGVISNAGTYVLPTGVPSARQAQDTWQLFNLLWQNAAPHDTGGGAKFNPICQMYDNTGATCDYGASAFDDFITNNRQMQIPLALGRSLIGLPPAVTVTSYTNGTGIFVVPNNTLFYVGAPVYLTAGAGGAVPSGFTADTIYYAFSDPTGVSFVTLQLASSYANALAGTALIPASDNGTAPFLLNFALGVGKTFGQSRHKQLRNEVGPHAHGIGSGAQNFITSGAGINQTFAGGDSFHATAATDDNTPSGYPFNVVQPSTYVNVFIKL